MSFISGRSSISLEDILKKTTESSILYFYLGITEIPCIINSPLREDKRPSFGLYSRDGKRIFYTDLSTGDRGGLFDLLSKMWGMSYVEVLERINKDIPKFSNGSNMKSYSPCNTVAIGKYNKLTDLQCKVREWERYDIEYWESYGITLKWLKYADVHPISYKIVIKDGVRRVYRADKYAYAYVERKDGKITLKIYQPFNKDGYKWSNKHDLSVISLWTKIPEYGDIVCICSSMKDALCLWANTGIPSLAVQGEGYRMSNTAINELKRRYKRIFILFDNDEAGLVDGEKLAKSTGFINLTLPKFEGGKDVSDLYRFLQNKEDFIKIIKGLFYKQ